ncbi:hypothetical protein [Actinomadura sp. 21ATH]|uniref:hypothetical protein n=1 Tax=Actinomadura sp. 21ATH TaxID=1735444 RepID=UPI0035C10F16
MALAAARSARRLTAAVAALVVATPAAAAIHQGAAVRSLAAGEDAGRTALAASRRVITDMFSLDHRTADRDIARALAGLTGKARQEFTAATPALKDQLVKHRTTSTITILAAGLTTLKKDAARTLVTADGNVRTPAVPNGAPKYYRWSLDLTRTEDRWLVSDLTLVP